MQIEVQTNEEWIGTHRCDRCGAAAKAYAETWDQASVLFLCGHHIAQHESSLDEQGWTVTKAC